MAKISNELKVAITVIASLVVALLGFRLMQDLPIFRQSHQVHANFERVDGLSSGNYVYINGVKVGSVREIQLSSPDSVRVTMGFDLGVNITRGSVAVLQSSGLLDEKTIVIEQGGPEEPVPYGGYIEGVYQGGMMETLTEEGERLSSDVSSSFDKLNAVLDELNMVLTEENRSSIRGTLSNLESTSGEISTLLNNKRSELETSIEHLNSTLANLDTLSTNNKPQIDTALVRLNRSLNDIDRLSNELVTTSSRLNNILNKIEQGEGTLGKLVNDSSLYNSYDSLAIEVKDLIRNINEDPNRYLKNMRLIEIF